MKIVTIIILSLAFIQTQVIEKNSDIKIIKQRIKAELTTYPGDHLGMDEIYKRYKKTNFTLAKNGSFSNINYSSKDRSQWTTAIHLLKVIDLISKRHKITNDTLLKNSITKQIHTSLNYWLVNDFRCPNWWYNEIFIPRVMGHIIILLEAELSKEQKQKALTIIARAKISRTGQNRLWLSYNVFLKALFTNDIKLCQKARNEMLGELKIASKEGIKQDWSFQQHGPMLYQGNYGKHFVQDSSYIAYILNGTSLKLNNQQIEILSNLILKGTQWMMWGEVLDYSTWGRQITYCDRFQGPGLYYSAMFMAKANTPQKRNFELFAKRIKNNSYGTTGAPSGNRLFYRSDFMVHRRSNFYFSVSMCSKRVKGSEICNQEGLKNYFLADGVTFISTNSNELRYIFPVWDWYRIPGVTCRQSSKKIPRFNNYYGKTNFVGGVSDGENGIAVMNYNRDKVIAKKAWFFLDNSIICLGAGITSTTTDPISTSVNQCLSNGKVFYQKSKQTKKELEKEIKLTTPSWVWHDDIAYLFPNKSNIKISNKIQTGNWKSIKNESPDKLVSRKVFSITIDHGIKPKNSNYCYLILPKAPIESLENYLDNNNITIIRNDDEVQAVKKESLYQILFHKATTLTLTDKLKIVVDKPCAMILKNPSNKLSIIISDPSQQQKIINLKINDQKLMITLPTGQKAGSSMVVNKLD